MSNLKGTRKLEFLFSNRLDLKVNRLKPFQISNSASSTNQLEHRSNRLDFQNSAIVFISQLIN